MGHHFSKPSGSRANSQKQSQLPCGGEEGSLKEFETFSLEAEESIQVEEEEVVATGSSPAEVRQIIIKIQLAKMENGNGAPAEKKAEAIGEGAATVAALSAVDTLNANLANGDRSSPVCPAEVPKTGGQLVAVNNNNLAGSVGAAISTLQLHDGNSNSNSKSSTGSTNKCELNEGDDDDDDDVVDESLLRRRNHEPEVVEYCEVLESLPVNGMLSTGTQHASKQGTYRSRNSTSNSCCRSRSSKALSMGAIVSTSGPAASAGSKRRCCKCKCRDAFKGLRDMLPSSGNCSSSNSHKPKDGTAVTVSRKSRNADRRSTPATLGASGGSTSQQRLQGGHHGRKRNSVAVPDASHHHQVIIRITSPHFVVESPSGRVTVVTEPMPGPTGVQSPPLTVALPNPAASGPASAAGSRNMVVHSQIDFMHCLVPDLEKITNSSFYWGKMDRYEAEHLLEGKPEGTFLLRDSAQEEFLFSVTFRKYGRSLHARIEQSGHKFSFDCHDPCVFTAPTVTGLLEHYKDPACVMFFEPCLTMPLHRRQTFSLEQLARATIVSNTSYDGINQLDLPGPLKSYLKEYHYKQKLRQPVGMNLAYYDDVGSESGHEDEDDDEEGVNIRVSYVQHADVVAQLQQQQQQQGQQIKPPSQLQEQLNRMAAALGRMSANLNCYQPVK
ncbi:hypothetical protein KR018_012319 [Drosophila ironensis]|nr:hypothetical protein KR018_012319 [Drosophila ironensis]